jgi:hypothetical protein
VIILGIALVASSAAAEPCADSAVLRAQLEKEARRASYWNWSWRFSFTALALGQFVLAASNQTNSDDRPGLWVGGAKSAFGALGMWTSPLRIEIPPAIDPCVDRLALRDAAERAGYEEKKAFWTGVVGGFVVNAIGAVIVAEASSARQGAISFATGYPLGLIQVVTMPKASWRRTRESTWTAGVVVGGGRYSLVAAGSF